MVVAGIMDVILDIVQDTRELECVMDSTVEASEILVLTASDRKTTIRVTAIVLAMVVLAHLATIPLPVKAALAQR